MTPYINFFPALIFLFLNDNTLPIPLIYTKQKDQITFRCLVFLKHHSANLKTVAKGSIDFL